MKTLQSEAIALRDTLETYAGARRYKGGLQTINVLISGLSIDDYENLIEEKEGLEIAIFPLSEVILAEYFGGVLLGFNYTVLISNYGEDMRLADSLKSALLSNLIPVSYNINSYETRPFLKEGLCERILFDLTIL